MAKSYSISEARKYLADLVSRAEHGKPVELTRRGHLARIIIWFSSLVRLVKKISHWTVFKSRRTAIYCVPSL